MRLKSNDLIFGVEAKKMRAFLRKCSYGNFNTDFFRDFLSLLIIYKNFKYAAHY